ncbi:MAG: hypothetical protein HN700_17220 [Verrucomicrobia bacterium]|nr:hypothetical protein [Verrucomicrobiota bacterium]
MDEKQLIEKLHRVEALFEGAGTDGEREAAANALGRLRRRLEDVQESDPVIEYRFTLADMWSRRLFVALLRRYGIRPYRYYRQRHTTVMAKVPKRFVDETLWPEYTELNKVLSSYLDETTERVISRGIHEDSSEAEVMKALPGA